MTDNITGSALPSQRRVKSSHGLVFFLRGLGLLITHSLSPTTDHRTQSLTASGHCLCTASGTSVGMRSKNGRG